MGEAAKKEEMKKVGINKLVCALSPEYIPGADSVQDKPGDIMHIFGCGLT